MLSFRINNDLFKNNDTRLFLRGKELHDYDKTIIVEVIRHYLKNNSQINVVNPSSDKGREILQFLHSMINHLDFDTLMTRLRATIVEELLGYCLLAFQNDEIDLMLRTTYTFGRVKPLEKANTWLDNYRLNSYGNALNRVMYKKFDHKSVYVIDTNPLPINENVEINYERMIKLIIGSLTAFIIDHNIFPETMMTNGGGLMNTTNFEQPSVTNDGRPMMNTNSKQSTIINNFEQPSVTNDGGRTLVTTNYGSRNLSPKQICDEFYQRFPFAFGGAHGCDAFFIGMTTTFEEIDKIFERYPSLRIGYILNTDGYRSGTGGSHWVALMLGKKRAQLICSQAGNFDGFKDNGAIQKTLRNLLFGISYNTQNIQTNSFSCGEFSVLALYTLIWSFDIGKAVNAIGVNAENIADGYNIESIRRKIIGIE